MADNLELNAGSGGAKLATALLSFSGDDAEFQICGGTILAGSEGAWTQTLIVGGAGVVTGGVQRVTLASDDPAVTALQVIDDWDESDRAKVNPIVGQAGIAAGAGAVGATVPRVTLASDDPAVATLGTIDADTSALAGCVGGTEVQVDVVSSALPTGAATSALQGGGLPAALGAGGGLKVDGSGTALPVSAASLPLPTGAATAALQGGGLPAALGVGGGLKVDGSGTALPVSAASLPLPTGAATETTLASVKTAVETIDNAISGSEMQVDVVASLPAGTNTIGGVIGQQSSSVAYDGTTACTIKRFNVVATADGDIIIAAPTGTKKILVRSLAIIGISTTITTIYLETGTTGTDSFGTVGNPIPVGVDADGNAHGGVVLPMNADGWFKTADADESLKIKMPGGNQAMLLIGTYIEVA